MKRFFRVTGQDDFDDFDLMILVHDVAFERQESKMTTLVRVTAGHYSVKTDPNSNGIFQQPLNIHIEQGTENLLIELLDFNRRVLATLTLNISKQIVRCVHSPEQLYPMQTVSKGIGKPKLKLTMVVDHEEDAEKGLLSKVNISPDVLVGVRQQMNKARMQGDIEGGISDREILRRAATGPLEFFEGLGKSNNVFVAVRGPPESRRWILGIWTDESDFHSNKRPFQEVDLLRVQGVQGDPTRHHVFVISYFDEARTPQTLTFRRTDRPRDVWVEILHLLVTKARDAKNAEKSDKEARRSKAVGTNSSNFSAFGKDSRKTGKKESFRKSQIP
jgi:hypothetical protein